MMDDDNGFHVLEDLGDDVITEQELELDLTSTSGRQ